MNKLLDFIMNPNNTYAQHTLDYTRLCAVAIGLAIIIGVLLGIAVARQPIAAFTAMNLCGLLRAIPAIAFLVVVLPYLGLGFVPALVALTVLGITPILVNTFTGIQGIDPAAIDAARGIGMTPYQVVRRIQVPLVLPVIAAGVRTAAIQIIATATLAGIIGAGGYGEYIYSGLYQLNNTQILAGALPVTILAILAEILLSQLQRILTPKGLRI
jgi:osmoprotectant transport system permease protein